MVFWNRCFRCSERLVCYIKRPKSFFHHLLSRSTTWEYRGLQGVTRGYRGLQGVTGGDKGWQLVTKDYTNFFLTWTFPDTFTWSILHKNQSWRNLKILTKTMDYPLCKNLNCLFFLNPCLYYLENLFSNENVTKYFFWVYFA